MNLNISSDPDEKRGQGKLYSKKDGFAVQTIWLTSARILSMLMSFLLPLMLVRMLSQKEFGVYKQAFQILGTSVSLLGLQVSGSVYYFIPREPTKKPQIATNTIIFYFIIGSLMALWFAINPDWVNALFKDSHLAPIIPMLGLAILLWLVASSFESIMIADGDTRRAAVLSIFLQLLKTGLLLAAAFAGAEIQSLVLSAVIFGALHCAIFLVYLYRRYGEFWRPIDWPLFKTQISNSIPYGFGGLIATVQYDMHNYFVSYHFQPADFAIYSVGCFQLPILMAMLDSTDSILIPEVSRLEKAGNYQGIIKAWMDAIRFMALFFVPACSMLYVLRHEFITALFTKSYLPSLPIFVLSLCNMLLLINLTLPVVRSFVNVKFFRLKLSLILLPLMVGALYLGIRLLGLPGAILAVVVVRFLDVTISVAVIARILGMSRGDLWRLGPLARIVAASIPAGLAAWLVRETTTAWPALVTLCVGAGVFGVVYLTAIFITGAITAAEKAALQTYLTKLYRSGAQRIGLPSATQP